MFTISIQLVMLSEFIIFISVDLNIHVSTDD